MRPRACMIFEPLVLFLRFDATIFHFFCRGISLAQDSRFKSADKKLLAKMKFAPELDQKVDLNKVEISALHLEIPHFEFSCCFVTAC